MGGQQSTRKLTLDNDDPTNVIKVSDAVVNRLKGNREVKKREGSMSSGAASIPSSPSLTPGFPTPYPPYMYEIQPTSLQVRQEKEAALKKNDAYWQKRINELEENHQRINKLMDKEYNEAVKEVKDGFTPIPAIPRKPACQDSKKCVMACYKKHPKEPMKCAKQVQEFADCVDKYRNSLISNQG